MASQFQEQWRGDVTKGLVLNDDSTKILDGAWLTAHNVRFARGAAELVGSYAALAAVPDATKAINYIGGFRNHDQTNVVVAATNDYVYQIQQAGILNRLNLAAMALKDGRWDAVPLLDQLYFCYPGTSLKVTNGQTWQNVAGNPPVGNRIAEFVGHLLLTRGGGNPQQINGSGLNDATDWNYANLASDADQMTLTQGGGAIQLIKRLGDYAAIYKEKSVHLLSYIQQPGTTYAQQTISNTVGAISQWAVDEMVGRHLVVSGMGIYAVDLSGPVSIGDRVWPMVKTLLKSEVESQIWVVANRNEDEIIIVIPRQNSTTLGLVYHYRDDSWSTRDWPYTAAASLSMEQAGPIIGALIGRIGSMVTPIAGAHSSREVFLLGDGEGGLGLYDMGNPSPLTAELVSGDTFHGDPWAVKKETGMVVRADATGAALQVYVCARMSASEPIQWRGPYAPDSRGKVDYSANGRLFRYRFVKPGGTFKMYGFAPVVRLVGR